MDQQLWVKRFNCDLDEILEKDKDVDLEVADNEYNKTLCLAQILKVADFSDESKVKDKLKQQLLKKIERRKEKQIPKDELSDEDLNSVAGGIGIDYKDPLVAVVDKKSSIKKKGEI